MKTVPPYALNRLSACAIAVLCAFAFAAQAADRPAKFAVAAGQLQVLGIQTTPLQSQVNAVRASYPAQVVIPPSAEQVISSPVAGLVSQLLVQQNQTVNAGAPLLRIASPELGQLQLQLLQANVRAKLARQAAQREQALFDEGLIAQRRVQESNAALQEADANLNQARSALRLIGMSMASIDQVAATGNPQDSLLLTATQSGVVTEIKAKLGQRVDSSSPLMQLAQTGKLWLEVQVPIADSTRWTAGTVVKVTGRDTTAQILSRSAVVASGSQMVVLSAQIQGKTSQLRPGELLAVELPMTASAGGWDLPLTALAHDGEQTYVFVRTPEGFEARAVKVVASAGQRVRIQGPVKAGEQVAISGVVALKGAWLDEKGAQ
jgi:cobalt-zinc-cadmium efflux system membrane fusion protein